jgi:hypothetical protein
MLAQHQKELTELGDDHQLQAPVSQPWHRQIGLGEAGRHKEWIVGALLKTPR